MEHTSHYNNWQWEWHFQYNELNFASKESVLFIYVNLDGNRRKKK